MAGELEAFRDAVLADARENFLEDLYGYRSAVHTDGNVEDRRKLVEVGIKLLGLEPRAKDDPLSGKTVVSITVVNGSTQIKTTQQEPALEVECRTVPQEVESAYQAPQVSAADISELVGGLDDLLGAAT
jgi:hypothetical protein